MALIWFYLFDIQLSWDGEVQFNFILRKSCQRNYTWNTPFCLIWQLSLWHFTAVTMTFDNCHYIIWLLSLWYLTDITMRFYCCHYDSWMRSLWHWMQSLIHFTSDTIAFDSCHYNIYLLSLWHLTVAVTGHYDIWHAVKCQLLGNVLVYQSMAFAHKS